MPSRRHLLSLPLVALARPRSLAGQVPASTPWAASTLEALGFDPTLGDTIVAELPNFPAVTGICVVRHGQPDIFLRDRWNNTTILIRNHEITFGPLIGGGNAPVYDPTVLGRNAVGGGTTTPDEIKRQPKVPVLAHYGDKDKHISVDSVEAFKKAQPGIEVQPSVQTEQQGLVQAALAVAELACKQLAGHKAPRVLIGGLKPARTYSKGMTQKLGLAACLLSRKAVQVLDEPTSGLDPKARALRARAGPGIEAREAVGRSLDHLGLVEAIGHGEDRGARRLDQRRQGSFVEGRAGRARRRRRSADGSRPRPNPGAAAAPGMATEGAETKAVGASRRHLGDDQEAADEGAAHAGHAEDRAHVALVAPALLCRRDVDRDLRQVQRLARDLQGVDRVDVVPVRVPYGPLRQRHGLPGDRVRRIGRVDEGGKRRADRVRRQAGRLRPWH